MTRTELTIAIKSNNLSRVQELLSASPDLLEELITEIDTVRYSPFVEAIIHKKLEIARFLVSMGANVHRRFDAAEEKGFTVAHWAVLNCKQDVLRFLLELKVDFRAATSRNTSPLTKSATINDVSALQFLLEDLQLDPRAKSFQGDSLLHIAAFSGRINPFRYLIRVHNLSIYEENDYHLTPAFKAAAGSVELLQELVSMGVDYSTMVNSRHNSYNYALWTPLHYACERGNVNTFQYLTKQMKLDVEARTYFSSNCLLIAAGSSVDLVKLLLSEYHQDPHIVNGFGENPVFIAAKHGKMEIVRYLWQTTGVNVMLRNRDGMGIVEAVKGKRWEVELREIVEKIRRGVWDKRKLLLATRLQLQQLKFT
jgi:hypothetical protein